MDTFRELFSHFFWVIFPVLGMGIGVFAIWTDHRRQVKVLELFEYYAEQGKEPPQSLIDALPDRSKTPAESRRELWGSFTLLLILTIGFGGAALFMMAYQGLWIFVLGFGITAFSLAAVAARQLVEVLLSPRTHGQ